MWSIDLRLVDNYYCCVSIGVVLKLKLYIKIVNAEINNVNKRD